MISFFLLLVPVLVSRTFFKDILPNIDPASFGDFISLSDATYTGSGTYCSGGGGLSARYQGKLIFNASYNKKKPY